MSIQAIHHYHNAVHKIYQYSGQKHEQAIKGEFFKLINHYCEKRNLLLVQEISIINRRGSVIRPDGIIKNSRRFNRGFWESKANVDLEKEINAKINSDYPLSNTLFQDENLAILYQDGQRCIKTPLDNEQALDELLTRFINHESHEEKAFTNAIEQFKKDLPTILETLRATMAHEEKTNKGFIIARESFLLLCQNSINASVTIADVNEMLLQHILTEDIFTSIFNNAQFHRENNIARELYAVEETFFKGAIKRNALLTIEPYYQVIKANATVIHDHRDKQFFLKSVYEDFYKAFNPKAADRLGIVYTPHEIVNFQIESVDYLLEKHFNKNLADKDIKILDPCTGTGTYICDLIEYLPPNRLKDKYENDIYANELGLLSYYIANLNIEYTYQQKMQQYVEFNHICWVDTLDNTGKLKDTNTDLFGLSVENTERIKKQNEQDISVIIGNPPYNAKQENYNQQNANRFYKDIDARIKNTYIKEGTAQNQIVIYDMYTRFLRWASDRLNENGIIAFISNNSFINSRAFDGFRKIVAKEFNEIWIINLKGDAHTSGERRKQEAGNIFDDKIRVGVAVYFLVKNKNKQGCNIYYHAIDDYTLAIDKKEYLKNNKIENIPFIKIHSDEKANWINQTDNDFDDLLPLVTKDVKAGKGDNAIFRLFSSGIKTQRDEWVYDLDKNNLENKIRFFVNTYQKTLKNSDFKDKHLIKFDRELDKYLQRNIEKHFEENCIVNCNYRPFTKMFFYFDKHFNGMTYQWFDIFNIRNFSIKNRYIAFNAIGGSKEFHCLASNEIIDLHFTGDSQCLPFYSYDKDGNRHGNITDWALNQFKTRYPNTPDLTKGDIFYYVYAVLHNPHYREKYAQNLKRDFPRIPFYADFEQWIEYGRRLMELHLNYEALEPYALQLETTGYCNNPKTKLKADKSNGTIQLDDNTRLSGIPASAWDYKLGNRSALEWVLDQYKEKKPKDQTIAEKFNNYRFADYKEQVIDLLCRVCTVSITTVAIVQALANLNREM